MAMNENYSIVQEVTSDLARRDYITTLLESIRPVWQSRSLIERVRRLLPVDPGSACQRLFNAAVHDLREKVIFAGIDIAREVAKDHKLPPIEETESVDEYPTAKLLELSYRMALLSRPEWRKLTRAYEIRRDLEHEDDEYEAALEDCIYIFKPCIEIVLSRDPIQPLRITDIKDVVEKPELVVPSIELLEDYQHAHQIRQEQICLYLISSSLSPEQPDLVRQNCFEMLQQLETLTQPQVKIKLAQHIQERIGRRTLDILHSKVAFACGSLPYLRQSQVRDFFGAYLKKMKQVGYLWRQYEQHGEILGDLEDIGGFQYCPDELRRSFLKWMILAYIGEPGEYGTMGRNRLVFYSNSAAPIIKRLVQNAGAKVFKELRDLEKDKDIKVAMSNKHVARRFEELVDLAEIAEAE